MFPDLLLPPGASGLSPPLAMHQPPHRHTLTYTRLYAVRPLIGLSGSVWILTGCGAAAVVKRHFSPRWRGKKRRRRKSVFWIKNLVSSCVEPHADSQLPVCVKLQGPPSPPPMLPPTLQTCCQGPSRLKAKLDNDASCLSWPCCLRDHGMRAIP